MTIIELVCTNSSSLDVVLQDILALDTMKILAPAIVKIL